MTTPIRVLQVIGSLTRGGIETWLMHVARHLDRDRFRMDFLVHSDQPAPYDDEAKRLGCRVLRCPYSKSPIRYAREFHRLLAEAGPFDVLHSHVHHFSGYILRLGRKAGVPVRIAHSHNDTRELDRNSGLARRAYLRLMTRWITRHATQRLACSREAGLALFGSPTERNPWTTLYIGVDLTPFEKPTNVADVRSEFGLAPDAIVLGHVGRLMEQKNHKFLVQIAAEACAREPRAHWWFVGDGPLQQSIEEQVRGLGLNDRVRFLGSRPDVPRLMGAMDAFVFPSLFEGLPLVGIEVQAAGLPLIMSDGITRELDVVPWLIRRMSLSQSPAAWAETALSAATEPKDRPRAFAQVSPSPFNIVQGVKELERVYAQSSILD